MKKHISQFLKSKGFYVLFFVAVVAIAAVSVIGVRISSKNKEKENLVDLNTPSVTSEEETAENEVSEPEANLDVAGSLGSITQDKTEYTNDELLEYDVYNDAEQEEAEASTEEGQEEVAEAAKETQQSESVEANTEEQTAEVEESVEVMQPNSALESLKFTSESAITWPVTGDVLMDYAMDKLVHFATLGEWKCNPAMVIKSEVGTDVTAAAKGVISAVEETDETGTTVTMNVGNGYEIVYGQLSDVTCQVGDVIQEGSAFAKIAEPTMYYSVEGSNLYFQVLCDNEPVNPMLFLSAE